MGKLEDEQQQDEPTKIATECSSATDSADTPVNGDEGKAEESETPVRGAATRKKRRGSSNGKAGAAAAKKKAAKASKDEALVPDEEFAALSALADKSRKFVGAHISAAGGVHNALIHCFQVKDKAKQENAYKALLDDLHRCEQLDIRLYNLHPGTCAGGVQDHTSAWLLADEKHDGRGGGASMQTRAIKAISIMLYAETSVHCCLSQAAVNRAHKDTTSVIVVLENMAGQKNVVGSKFEDLRDIIKLIKNKDRVRQKNPTMISSLE
ncbi:hypothetical protein Emag_002496 [Eimeria magna]